VLASHAGALEGLLELSPDAVLVVDQAGVIRHVNERAAAHLRCRQQRLVGSQIEDFVPEHLRATHRADRDRFRATPSRRTMGSGRQLLARRTDGTTFSVDISLQPISVDGEVLVVAVLRDQSVRDDLRLRNDELARDADALRRFIDVASHELRTPLTSVLGFAETLLEQPDMSSELRTHLLHRLAHNARREEALLSGLLDMSRLHNGKLAVAVGPVDLAATTHEVCDSFDNIDITCTVPDGLAVLADGLRVQQILTNLLTNAVRYEAPPITVDADTVGGADGTLVRLRVCDQGPGVSEEFEESLFKAFSQQSSGDRREAAGLGLGLYLCAHLVQAMSGSIDYVRLEPTGSCFEVLLPTP
jgi:PAS domain S-box-containing protein